MSAATQASNHGTTVLYSLSPTPAPAGPEVCSPLLEARFYNPCKDVRK